MNVQIAEVGNIYLGNGQDSSAAFDRPSLPVDSLENRENQRLHQIVRPTHIRPLVRIDLASSRPWFEQILLSCKDAPVPEEPPRTVYMEAVFPPRFVSVSSNVAELDVEHCECSSPDREALADQHGQRLLGCCVLSHLVILHGPTLTFSGGAFSDVPSKVVFATSFSSIWIRCKPEQRRKHPHDHKESGTANDGNGVPDHVRSERVPPVRSDEKQITDLRSSHRASNQSDYEYRD